MIRFLMTPFFAAAILACAGCGGGGAKNYNTMISTTLGEELRDLKIAYESGALSEEEYRKERADLLKSR